MTDFAFAGNIGGLGASGLSGEPGGLPPRPSPRAADSPSSDPSATAPTPTAPLSRKCRRVCRRAIWWRRFIAFEPRSTRAARVGLPGVLFQEVEHLDDLLRVDAVPRPLALVEAVALDHLGDQPGVPQLLAGVEVVDRGVGARPRVVPERR